MNHRFLSFHILFSALQCHSLAYHRNSDNIVGLNSEVETHQLDGAHEALMDATGIKYHRNYNRISILHFLALR